MTNLGEKRLSFDGYAPRVFHLTMQEDIFQTSVGESGFGVNPCERKPPPPPLYFTFPSICVGVKCTFHRVAKSSMAKCF